MMKWFTRFFRRRQAPFVAAWGTISQEQAREFQQVAALVCMDIDLLCDIAERPDTTLESLRFQVLHIQRMKAEATTDPVKRERRYVSAAFLYSLPRWNEESQSVEYPQ